MRTGSIVLSVALISCTAIGAVAQSPHYHVVDTIVVGPGPDFSTIDATHRRLYGMGPYVVDIDAKHVVGAVDDFTAGGGFVIAPELGRGVVRNGTVFDLASGKVVGQVTAMGDASLYDPATGRAFLLGDSVSAIDVRSGTLAGKVQVNGARESGVADGNGKIYLNLSTTDSIAVVDAKTLRRIDGFAVAPCKSPLGLAIDRRHRRLFAACVGALWVIDADNGRLVASVPTLGHSDQNAFDPGTGLIFMPSPRGLVIVHEDAPDRYAAVQTLTDSVLKSNKIVVDEKTHRAYMPYQRLSGMFAYLVLEPAQ